MIVYVRYCVCEGDGVREPKSVTVSWGLGEGGSSRFRCRQRGWEETINLGDVLFISQPFSWVNRAERKVHADSSLRGRKHGGGMGEEEVAL